MLKHELDRNSLPGLCPKDGIGIELGVWRGGFSKIILEESELGLLLSIDAWNTGNWSGPEQHKLALRKLAKFGSRSVVMKIDFTEAANVIPNEWADFIYIDGRHDYRSVNTDIRNWWPKLKPGGLFAGHDYEEYRNFGVIRAVDQFVKEQRLELFVTSVNSRRDAVAVNWFDDRTDWGFRSWYCYKT